MKRFALLALLSSCLVVPAVAETAAEKAFNRLAKLVGTWEGGVVGAKDNTKNTVTYRLTGGGSALMETMLPGTPEEMVTMYHLDGANLVMTHYCAAHNQPTMKFLPGKDPNVLKFDFVSGRNMKPSDMHMHSLTMKLIDADHLIAEWTAFMKGKPILPADRFEMHRVKTGMK